MYKPLRNENKDGGKEKQQGDEDDDKYNNMLSGNLTPDDPVNNEYINNIEVLADPVYTPENYIFVKQFNDQMNRIMNKLGKYEDGEEPSPEDENIEITQNYLSHLNTLFNKSVPFLDDLHKEIINSPTGQYPNIKDEKEENLNNILNGAELYYKTDEDGEIKSDAAKNMFDACLNLVDDLSRDGIIDKDKEGMKEQLEERENKLWSLLTHAVKNDDKNQILAPNNTHRVRDLIKKINDSINNKGQKNDKVRYIPLYLSKRLENGEDKVGQDLLDFTVDDLQKHGDEDEEIKDIDLESLSNLSKFPGLMKQMIKNDSLWNYLKNNYFSDNLTNKKRALLSKLFNNASKSNYNIENMINNDPQGIKTLLDKIINDPVKSLDDGGDEIAEAEVGTLCNILKDRNNYKALSKGDLITDNDIIKLDSLYKDLDPKIGEPLRPIIAQIREADKAKKEKDDVAEDEKKILDLETRIGNCFEGHKKALLNYVSKNKSLQRKLSDGRFGDYGTNKDDNDDKPIPGKLKSPFDQQTNKGGGEKNNFLGKIKNKLYEGRGSSGDNDLLKNASSLRKMSFVSGTLLLHQADNAKIKSSLSTLENPQISDDLNKVLSLLRKNYNDMKTTEDPELNLKRSDNVHKCLNLLKKMSLAPDNHKPILEGGLMNFLEKLDDDYKLFKEDGEPDLNNRNLGFSVDGKNVLQACSNSDNAIPIISESPVFDSTINEVTKLYNKPELIAASSDIQKLFSYDNVIFSNLCKNKTAFDSIFNTMGLDKLLSLGKKTGNSDLLNAILNMLNNYIKNTPNIDEMPPELLDSTLKIMNKCTNLRDRNPALMTNVLNLATLLYNNDNLKPRIDNLYLIKSMNNDINRFKGNHDYLNSCLNSISTLTKDSPVNGQQALDSGLIQKLNNQVSDIVKEGPEKYEENKSHNEGENGYLKTCCNLSQLYSSLVRNDISNIDKFNNMGITQNAVNMIDVFNEKVEPKNEDEVQQELYKKLDPENINYLRPPEMIRSIMSNCAETLEQITVPQSSNEYLANKTNFAESIIKSLENPNNDPEYLISALHALSNYLFNESGKNYEILDLPQVYSLLKDLQQNYYANPEILMNINCISGALVKNLKDDNKGKEYVKKFYDLIPETTKLQDYNPDLVNMSLKLMHDGLIKKPYLVDEVYDETVPNVFNLLKLYKDSPEIQESGYKILSLFAKNNVFSFSMIGNGLLDVMKATLENALFSDSLDNIVELKSEIYKLLNGLVGEKENCPKIADELMGNLIVNLNEKGYNDEGKIIVPLLNTLCLNNQCIPSFVQYKGIETCIKLLNDNDTNIELISNVFSILKNIAKASDEYKRMLQEKKVPDLINRIIKKVGAYDKKIEFEGRQLLFNVNLCKIQLEDPNSIGVDEIKIVEPIPPEVRNFLTNGKQVKIINDHGDIKQMQLIFSPDLMKVSAKKIKSHLPPKPKYIIDTITIKKILKGHGTDAFKKSKGLFRKIPPPEVCFSIIGPTSVDGVKSLNVQCDNEKEVDRWIKYLQIVINYFKKTHAIKGAVIIKK